MQQLELASGWQLKERDSRRAIDQDFATHDGWIAARVPGTVHEALLAAGQIPDPFYGLNEQAVQWIGERDWLYRCSFEVAPDLLQHGAIDLCFDGLDTIATVWLNREQIHQSDNMFVPAHVDVGGRLRPGHNDLRILLESALRHGKAGESQYGTRAVWNGDPSRVYVRKAQYHYGWDWGPCLLTAGPWQPVRLVAYDSRITDLHCSIAVADDLNYAMLPVDVAVATHGDSQADLALFLVLHDPSGAVLAEARLPAMTHTQHTFTIDQPRLWWPNGYGAQPLYRLTATLMSDDSVLDQRSQRLGARKLRLAQEPVAGEAGTSFLFEINNVPLFCGGANWIPADSFTTRITDDQYRAWLRLAVEANMTMLRVWGGGIYEADVFYETCDELGLLVWQDFMFACGIYPAHESFQRSVRAEAEAQVRRLRHHPSLALWCGNNEDYQLARSVGVYDSRFDGDFATTGFPARAIYERLLPEVCESLDPTRPYRPGSPFDGDDPDDQTVGDRHAWEVWKGSDYHNYPEYEGRFVSEFGMAAAPDLRTIAEFAPPEERYAASRTFEHHIKADEGPRRLAGYISDNLRLPATLDDYVYATQLVQAEALGLAYRSWRRRWGGPGRYAVAGALVWQLNDCWPVTSWAIVDHALRPKPAYFVIRRELAPVALGLARDGDGAAIWAVNGTTDAVEAELIVEVHRLSGESDVVEQRHVTLRQSQATELGVTSLDQHESSVVAARLTHGGRVIARASLWPEPFKYLALPDPELRLTRLEGEQIRLEVSRPAKGVWLSGGDGVAWSDNMLDVVPGDPQIVTARGLGEAQITWRWLGDGDTVTG